MAYIFGSEWHLLAGIFDPIPNPATLAINLITVGIYIAVSIILSALEPMPHVVGMSGSYIQCAFAGALAMIFIFGLWMICLGWLVADYPERYTALGRTVTRASHVVLVFVITLHEVTSASMAAANNDNK